MMWYNLFFLLTFHFISIALFWITFSKFELVAVFSRTIVITSEIINSTCLDAGWLRRR